MWAETRPLDWTTTNQFDHKIPNRESVRVDGKYTVIHYSRQIFSPHILNKETSAHSPQIYFFSYLSRFFALSKGKNYLDIHHNHNAIITAADVKLLTCQPHPLCVYSYTCTATSELNPLNLCQVFSNAVPAPKYIARVVLMRIGVHIDRMLLVEGSPPNSHNIGSTSHQLLLNQGHKHRILRPSDLLNEFALL